MKLFFLGNPEECAGFSLAGAESIPVEEPSQFTDTMKRLLDNPESGVIIVADRFFGKYESTFSKRREKEAVPTVIFVPSIDGKHLQQTIKGYLSSVLGIRL